VRSRGGGKGIDSISLTKLDVLDGLETIEICTGYQIGDRTVTEFPSDLNTAGTITPIYESWPGWTAPTKGAREYNQLPVEARKYVARLEEVGLSVPIVGDFHYNGHILLREFPETARLPAKYRLNPRHVGAGQHPSPNIPPHSAVPQNLDKTRRRPRGTGGARTTASAGG